MSDLDVALEQLRAEWPWSWTVSVNGTGGTLRADLVGGRVTVNRMPRGRWQAFVLVAKVGALSATGSMADSPVAAVREQLESLGALRRQFLDQAAAIHVVLRTAGVP